MRTNKSLSLLKINKELNQRVLGKIFYLDPCFTNLIDDKLQKKDFQIQNLYRRRLPNLFTNDSIQERKEVMLNSGISSPLLKKYNEAASKHLFDFSMKKEGTSSTLWKTKNKDFNQPLSHFSPLASMSSSKRSSETFSCSPCCQSRHREIQDDFNSHVHYSINLIDKKYKLKLNSLKALPYISIKIRKRRKNNIITNEFIKAQLDNK